MSTPTHDPDATEQRSRWLVMGGCVLALALGTYFVVSMLSGNKDQPKRAPKISLMTPPSAPPPPPPPPKFEKKPDPPKEQKEMKVDQPVQKQDAPPPSPELKMDGPAGDGPSAFAAGKVTNEDLSKVGKPGGTGSEKSGMFNPFTNYATLLKGEMQRALNKNPNLRRRRYAIETQVWVTGSGAMQKIELLGTSGDPDTDEAVRQALNNLPSFSQTPPANMPQPIRLRIATNG